MKPDTYQAATPAPNHANQPAESAWQARLSLGFAADSSNGGNTTRLIERSHVGPLRVQKPLYPEGPKICHAIIIHPPGGVVGGDALAIGVTVGQAAQAFIATPGAAKWYKANGKVSRQEVTLDVGPGASLEWMPQETIFFDAADVVLRQNIALATDATYIACEILCFGRTASGESFRSGKISQHTSIRRDGKLIWWEQGSLAGGAAMMHSALGLGGKTVCATLIACGKTVPKALLDSIRDAAGTPGNFGITQTKTILVARYLGDSSETARRIMLLVWQQLRPALIGRQGEVPRIWLT
jgi:urease accessory protein